MSAIAKAGTVNHTRDAHAWAPAALACMGVVFGDIGTAHSTNKRPISLLTTSQMDGVSEAAALRFSRLAGVLE